MDYKILTKALALRIEKVVSSIIHEDQTGFIVNHQSYFNIRRLLNILYSDHSVDHPEIIVSLDTEKAFDCVDWQYLFSVLKKKMASVLSLFHGSGLCTQRPCLQSAPIRPFQNTFPYIEVPDRDAP